MLGVFNVIIDLLQWFQCTAVQHEGWDWINNNMRLKSSRRHACQLITPANKRKKMQKLLVS